MPRIVRLPSSRAALRCCVELHFEAGVRYHLRRHYMPLATESVSDDGTTLFPPPFPFFIASGAFADMPGLYAGVTGRVITTGRAPGYLSQRHVGPLLCFGTTWTDACALADRIAYHIVYLRNASGGGGACAGACAGAGGSDSGSGGGLRDVPRLVLPPPPSHADAAPLVWTMDTHTLQWSCASREATAAQPPPPKRKRTLWHYMASPPSPPPSSPRPSDAGPLDLVALAEVAVARMQAGQALEGEEAPRDADHETWDVAAMARTLDDALRAARGRNARHIASTHAVRHSRNPVAWVLTTSATGTVRRAPPRAPAPRTAACLQEQCARIRKAAQGGAARLVCIPAVPNDLTTAPDAPHRASHRASRRATPRNAARRRETDAVHCRRRVAHRRGADVDPTTPPGTHAVHNGDAPCAAAAALPPCAADACSACRAAHAASYLTVPSYRRAAMAALGKMAHSTCAPDAASADDVTRLVTESVRDMPWEGAVCMDITPARAPGLGDMVGCMAWDAAQAAQGDAAAAPTRSAFALAREAVALELSCAALCSCTAWAMH